MNFLLEELGQSFSALHSSKSQPLRLSALHRFKSGQVPVLIATDLANRGLDIPTVDLVINYDIPRSYSSMDFIICYVLLEIWFLELNCHTTCSDPKDYVHRVGRTARAGRGGLAVSFVTEVSSRHDCCEMG